MVGFPLEKQGSAGFGGVSGGGGGWRDSEEVDHYPIIRAHLTRVRLYDGRVT